MATGDITVFQEAKEYMLDGGWEAADDIKCAVLDNTLAPLVGDATPALADYTEVETAGSYPAGGDSLGTWGAMVTQTGGVMKLDSATNPTWAQNVSNGVDAYWGLIYHVTTDQAIAFVELGGPVNMQAGDLTINWPAAGIFTIT